MFEIAVDIYEKQKYFVTSPEAKNKSSSRILRKQN